jgi:RNA polymerase sigma-70 factor (ECF subfamily)
MNSVKGSVKNQGRDEVALVRRAAKGDKEAFQELILEYQQRVFSLAFQILGSKADAEDVTQESFVKAYLSLKNFRGDSSFYTWMYRIVRNMAIDHKRKRRRIDRGENEFDASRDYPEAEGVMHGAVPRSAEEQLATRQDLVRLDEAVKNLSEAHRAVLMLREVDGLSYEEIAKVLGLKRGTVMSRLFYAREKLQEELGDSSEREANRLKQNKEILLGGEMSISEVKSYAPES